MIQRDSDHEDGSGYLSVCVCLGVSEVHQTPTKKKSFLIPDPFK